jgi:hypothetical protein
MGKNTSIKIRGKIRCLRARERAGGARARPRRRCIPGVFPQARALWFNPRAHSVDKDSAGALGLSIVSLNLNKHQGKTVKNFIT